MTHRERYLPPNVGDPISTLKTVYVDKVQEFSNTDVYKHDWTEELRTYLGGSQVTDSESHPEWLRRDKRRFHGDLGGPFTTIKKDAYLEGGVRTLTRSWDHDWHVLFPEGRYHEDLKYEGLILPFPAQYISFPDELHPSSDDSLDEFGTTAIARCSPSNPTADLTVALGELMHEGFPKIIGGTLGAWRKLTPRDRQKAIAGEYLNVEFGWKPLVKDIRDLAKSVLRANAILSNYIANSGKMVRRSYSFPKEETANTWVVLQGITPYYQPSHAGLSYSPSTGTKIHVIDRTIVERWFTGAFTYYVPPVGGLRNTIAHYVIQARKLLGLSLTPDSLWNLAPWSWAFDWFSDTGDLLANWTDWAIDNQVLLYGYIMEHKTSTRSYVWEGDPGFYSGGLPGTLVTRRETKVRRPATPFGFGLQWSDLSDRQKAIITALGISKSR